jgi:peroxiredoxin
MSSVKYGILLLFFLLGACGEMADDLTPSGKDQRPTFAAGTVGWGVGQNAPPFSTPDINNTTVDLAAALSGKKGAVLYFTMWCSICDGHMMDTVDNVMPDFADVGFFAVDYLTGSVTQAKEAASNAGYLNSGFTILADLNRQLARDYNATMGTTIVIDSSGVVRMNEDYKDGARLRIALAELPATLP